MSSCHNIVVSSKQTAIAILKLSRMVFLVATLFWSHVPLSAAQSTADVVFVVDTSGGMASEVDVFKNSISNSFIQPLLNAGIDVHVVLIASDTVCIPAPVGGANCPGDDNLPLYRHVAEPIGSSDALVKTITTYASWAPSMRANSNRTIVVLSDGDSSQLAEDFNSALLSIDQGFEGYKFHGIVDTSGCATIGTEYIELASLTNGTLYDLCGEFGDAGVALALAAIANIIISDVGTVSPPPSSSICKETANAAIDAGSAYLKAARVVRRLCKSDSLDCMNALAQASDALVSLSGANDGMQISCP